MRSKKEAMRDVGKVRRHKIIFQYQDTIKEPGGHYKKWLDFFTTWASINPLVGREYLEGKQIQNEVTAKINIRYKAGITPEMKIASGQKKYDIVSIINVKEANRELVIMAKEVV